MDVKTKAQITEMETLFALDKPSLHALSYALRHPDTWPNGFVWNYTFCDQCAMGLAHLLWNIGRAGKSNGATIMARAFAMPYTKAEDIFFKTNRAFANRRVLHLFPADYKTVTPDMVADQIDKYLKGKE